MESGKEFTVIGLILNHHRKNKPFITNCLPVDTVLNVFLSEGKADQKEEESVKVSYKVIFLIVMLRQVVINMNYCRL